MSVPVVGDPVWAAARSRAEIVARTLTDTQAPRRLSVDEAALRLGVDRSTVFRWRARFEAERGVTPVTSPAIVAAWPPGGKIAAAGMAMWGLLADLGLVHHGDELVVKDILAGTQHVAN